MVGYLWTLSVLVCVGAQSREDYRLPLDLVPLSYRLIVEPNLEDGLFEAELTMEFRALRESKALVLNAKNLTLDYTSFTLKNKAGTWLAVPRVQEDPLLQRITILPELPFAKDNVYTVHVAYTGLITEDGAGFYKNRYTDDAGNVRVFGVTQLRPVHARKVFPCLDEPMFRANIQLSIVHDGSCHAISSMPVATMTAIKGNRVMTTFKPTPKIPPFLLAFMVSDLPRVMNGDFSSFAVPSKIESAVFAGQIGPAMVQVMASHFNIPYSLNKTDLVALPFLIPVAMENWGLYTFREENMLYTEGVSKTIQKQTVGRFVGHEVTHAWMGNPVSIGWWDYLWLSEVFAMYYEYYLPGRVEPSWRMMDQLVVDLHQSGLLADSMSAEPLTTSILTPDQITAKFGGVTYSKGPALLRMVIHVLTEQSFINSFSHFLRKNAYNSVEPNDLWNAMEQKGLPAPLSEIMTNWTTTSGYPVITVVRDDKGQLYLSQSTFKLNPTGASDDKRWWIPLSYTTSTEKNFGLTVPRAWFPPQPALHFRMSLRPEDWIIFNIDSTGFYRVNYDGDNWRSLTIQMIGNHKEIGTLNRAQLLDDSLNLARGGQLGYGIALDLACYLAHERSFVPWASALNAFTYLDEILIHTNIHGHFMEYMTTLLEGAYNDIGFDSKRGEPHLNKILRELIVKWACQNGNEDCIRRSLQYFGSLTPRYQLKNNRISVDVRDTALCTAVAAGTDIEWQHARSLYQNAPTEDKPRFLAALACSKDPNKIQGLLVGSYNQIVNESDWSVVFTGMARRKENAQTLLDFLVTNYDTIVKRFGASNLTKYVNQISPFLTTKSQEGKLGDLERLAAIDLTTRKNGITARAAWLDRNMPQLNKYFLAS